jgi:hypothetical protein
MALTKVKAGNILLTTPSASSNDVTPATTAYVTTALANLADSAPETLNTLNELAAALGDDANFSTTVTNSIAAKAPLASPTFTGTVEIPNLTISSAQGTDGQVLTSTGSGIAWESIPAGYTDSDVETYLNTSEIYTDATNNRLGIGTDTPGYLLTVKKDVDAFAVKIENDGNSAGTSGASYADASDGLWVDTRWNTATNTPFKVTSNSGTTPMMIIKGDGKVGIGTDSPATDLHVYHPTSHSEIRVGTSGSSDAKVPAVSFNNTVVEWGIGVKADNHLHIRENTASYASRVTIADGGNVGIGTQAPAQPLHVLSSTALTAGVARFQYSGGNDYEVIRVESLGNNDAHIGFFADGDTNYYGGFGIDYSDAGKFKLQTDNLFVGGSNLMTWARDGKVGIGTTNPSETLHLNAGGGGPELRFENASGSHYIRAYNDNWNFLANSTNTAMTIRNSGQVEFGGKVGIGTNDPSSGYGGAISAAKLAILSGTAGSDGGSSTILIGGDNKHYAYMQGTHISGGATQLDFGTASGAINPTLKMRIASNGSIGAPSGTNIYNASDERLKQNISTLSNSLDVINALNPVKFNWIDNFEESENDKTLYGFVAQEVQETFPDAVESFGNDVEVDGTVVENPLTVRDKFFIPVLVKAIQEQQALIESLTARIATLES